MTRKRWGILTLALTLLSLAAIAGSVILVDPFEIYRKASWYIPPIESGTQDYSNAGIARSYDYDSIVVGSSMTENFTPSQMDELLGGYFIKLSVHGGSPANHMRMMDLAFQTHEIKTVVYGLDVDALTYFYKDSRSDIPEYLYTLSPLDDVSYWFNKTVLSKYIPKCLATAGQTNPDQRDTMYTWGNLYTYGAKAALKGAKISDKEYTQKTGYEGGQLSQQSMLNIKYDILPFIEAHPETKFIFFIPPYSLVRWYSFYKQQTLEYHLNQKEGAIRELLAYDNVTVYDFSARTDWICNLDNYIDNAHYGPWINSAMTECMSTGENRVTSDSQVEENNAIIREGVEQIVAAGAWPKSFQFSALAASEK